jgi:hypothetical protein
MASPKGAYTPKSGPLAGTTYSSYFRYQTARAQYAGFKSYSAERGAKLNPLFIVVQERALAKGQGRAQALQTAQSIVGDLKVATGPGTRGAHVDTDTGSAMGKVVKALYDQGLYDYGEDVAESIYYE